MLRASCRKIVASSRSLVRQDICRSCSPALTTDETLSHQRSDFPLKSAARHLGEQRLEIGYGHSTILQYVAQSLCLPVRKSILPTENILPNRRLTPLLDLVELRGESYGELLDQARHIHVGASDSLKRSIEGQPIAVVVFAYGEEPLEIVACLVEQQRRKQTRRASVPVEKRVNVDKLELGDGADNYRMYVGRSIQPTDEFTHQLWHSLGGGGV